MNEVEDKLRVRADLHYSRKTLLILVTIKLLSGKELRCRKEKPAVAAIISRRQKVLLTKYFKTVQKNMLNGTTSPEEDTE